MEALNFACNTAWNYIRSSNPSSSSSSSSTPPPVISEPLRACQPAPVLELQNLQRTQAYWSTRATLCRDAMELEGGKAWTNYELERQATRFEAAATKSAEQAHALKSALESTTPSLTVVSQLKEHHENCNRLNKIVPNGPAHLSEFAQSCIRNRSETIAKIWDCERILTVRGIRVPTESDLKDHTSMEVYRSLNAVPLNYNPYAHYGCGYEAHQLPRVPAPAPAPTPPPGSPEIREGNIRLTPIKKA